MVGVMLELNYYMIGGISLILMVIIGALFYFYTYWSDIRSNYPELAVHQEARKRPHPPIIDVMDASGGHRSFVGTKKKPQSSTFKNEENGLIFDPRLHSTVPADHLADGTKIFTYCTTYDFPIDNFGAVAVSQAISRVRKEYPQIGFIKDDFAIMEILQKSATDMPHDLSILLNTYKQEDSEEILKVEDLCAIFEDIKIKLKTWNVESGFYSLSEAINKLPFGLTASDVQRIINLAKMEERNDSKQADMDKYLPIYIIGAFVTMMVIAYMVLK